MPGFRRSLETEFITPGGRFIPFRSAYTGFAAPGLGGAVMQSFPCFFLNAALPDIAQRQWEMLRQDVQKSGWKRALWPVDVGNYSFSRASSYAATALAAREMGDHAAAEELLGHMVNDCPVKDNSGVAHHSRASLWSNAYAFAARTGKKDGLRDLAVQPRARCEAPVLEQARYCDVLIAKAKPMDGALELVLYPAHKPGLKTLTLSGLMPGQPYRSKRGAAAAFRADASGRKVINVPVHGRTELHISRVA